MKKRRYEHKNFEDKTLVHTAHVRDPSGRNREYGGRTTHTYFPEKRDMRSSMNTTSIFDRLGAEDITQVNQSSRPSARHDGRRHSPTCFPKERDIRANVTGVSVFDRLDAAVYRNEHEGEHENWDRRSGQTYSNERNRYSHWNTEHRQSSNLGLLKGRLERGDHRSRSGPGYDYTSGCRGRGRDYHCGGDEGQGGRSGDDLRGKLPGFRGAARGRGSHDPRGT